MGRSSSGCGAGWLGLAAFTNTASGAGWAGRRYGPRRHGRFPPRLRRSSQIHSVTFPRLRRLLPREPLAALPAGVPPADEMMERFRFLAVLGSRSAEHGCGPCVRSRWSESPPCTNEHQLVLRPRIVSHADLVLHPDHVGLVAIAPRVHDLQSFPEFRRRYPKE